MRRIKPGSPGRNAPWTDEEVANLAGYQGADVFHPMACECGAVLVPHRKGWACEACGEKKKSAWAFEWQLDGTWRTMLADVKAGISLYVFDQSNGGGKT
jgi:hypothetical protein